MPKNSILVKLSIWTIINIWQKRIGKWYDNKKNILCRFYPTCSQYAILALDKYGFIKGWKLAYLRFKRCTNQNTDSCIDYP
jgi:hypothetical protein